MADDLTSMERLRELTSELGARPEDVLWASYIHSQFPKLISSFDGHIFVVNRAFENLLGYTEDDLHGMGWLTLTHPDDVALDVEYAGRLAAGDLFYYQIRKRYRKADGEYMWVYLNVERVDIPGREPIAICLAQPSPQEGLKITGMRK